jgi:23S rRNA pseudouridine1911/1915/1917 synthase
MRQNRFTVLRADAVRTLASLLQKHFSLPWPKACAWIREGRVSVSGKPCANPQRLLRPGQRVQVRGLPSNRRSTESKSKTEDRRKSVPPQAKKHSGKGLDSERPQRLRGKSLPAAAILYVDKHILIVDKPAGLTTVRHADEAAEFGKRARRYLPPTLAEILPDLLAQKGRNSRLPRVLAVHRLDKETSGLMVFALTKEAETHLGRQMRAHNVGRKYVALVRGRAQSERIESHLVPDRGDGRRGSAAKSDEGKRAVTHVRLLEKLGEYSLVECTLETGRTHQIRIHLGERGTPLCGERIYDRPLHGQPVPDKSGAKRPLLHAGFLEIEHPASGKRMSWSAPLPEDMQAHLQRLRREGQ